MGPFYCNSGIHTVNSTLATWLLLAVPGLPLLLAVALMFNSLRQTVLLFAPWAALPALVTALLANPGFSMELPWLLLGSHIGFDETARIFLLFTSLLWLVAGVYSTGYFSSQTSLGSFFAWFLPAMAGNLGLILAQDMILFYTFFALMSFASYGLVVFDRGQDALRAGRIYIILVAAGEVMLFAAFVLAATAAESIEFVSVQIAMPGAELRNWIMALTLLGFGIKAGLIGLHVWLPLAHPVAPTPASAVLSGAMIAAGLLGWLRVLPLGVTALPDWGGIMIAAGMIAAFYAVFTGIFQSNAKTVLAYSSISTMGVMIAGVGLGLVAPERWPLILAAVLVYAFQHGLAKGALFLGVDMALTSPMSKGQRFLLIMGLLLPALSLAGAPLTSGMIAKHLLNVQLTSISSIWSNGMQALLPWCAVATSVLMGRFLYMLWARNRVASATGRKYSMQWLSWVALVVIVILAPGLILFAELMESWSTSVVINALGPVVLGSCLVALALRLSKYRHSTHGISISSGDVLIVVEKWFWPVLVSGCTYCSTVLRKKRSLLLARLDEWRGVSTAALFFQIGENRLRQWVVATMLLLMLVIVIAFLAGQNIF